MSRYVIEILEDNVDRSGNFGEWLVRDASDRAEARLINYFVIW